MTTSLNPKMNHKNMMMRRNLKIRKHENYDACKRN
jgi:hypothetical protein